MAILMKPKPASMFGKGFIPRVNANRLRIKKDLLF